MVTSACVILRHDIRPRWIGDLHAAYCHTCGCLYIPRHDSQQGTGPEVVPPVASSGVLLDAMTAPAGRTG